MSANNSNLTEAGYDLVLGVTQDAINASLKRFLDSGDQNFEPVYYVYTNDNADEVVPISLDDLLALTVTDNWPNGVDPFSPQLIDGTDNHSDPSVSQEGAEALYDAYFAFAFSATVGIPRNAPDVVTLYDPNNPNAQAVQYNMYFEDFTTVDLELGTHSAWTYIRRDQPSDNPWVYTWKVDLDISTSNQNFADLPSDTQKAIQNLNPNTAFSIQQLALDFTNAPQYDGNIEDSGAYIPDERLYEDYLNQYWDMLQASEANVLLNAVQPVTVTSPTPSIVPTVMNFVVTPYDAQSSSGLDTLNYLMMTEGRALPSPIAPLGWQWIDESVPTTDRPDGVMAVSRTAFANYLNDLFSPGLDNICLNPTLDLQGDGLKVKLVYDQTFHTGNRYTLMDAGSHVLSFYYKSPVSKDDIMAKSWSTEIWASINSDVYLEGNTIRCVTLGLVYMDIEVTWGASKTRGYAVAQQNTTTFELSFNEDGSLHVNPTTESEDLTQDTDKNGAYYDGDLDPSVWAQFATGGGMDDWVDYVSGYVTKLTDWMNGYDDDLNAALSGMTAWVFPGDNTFTFANPFFSDAQDLTAEVKYTTTD